MPITQEDIREHYDYYGITQLDDLHTSEYRQLVNGHAFFFQDSGGSLRHTFSEEILATNKEQLDVLIEQLQAFREIMNDAPDWMSEK
ncbi:MULTISPECIES: hypothetical protein [Xenorhabdus]|uniref:Uncharacterized protein n=1 Tax=Xenorhabdus ishibashii TaxID=1034471 RepID=A0A2D0K723_9GAMM|nr:MULTISPECIES: hypothetical protein [Xenorhabdus]PHM39245.1 hypothetical protein Xszus_04350 [Xenorhabdus szentirmaii]PHM59160.1 hypothetical protein Xish_03691 [Xenorhabdus ishibashii]PHM60029.1 hypothetical protein Xish_03172 [Xenorhabdus ishibashii]PHM60055.1 hypothetical protein Xish_03198 [Xenorhabdus ishibashii]PHM60063.1 hypothetical protein Xish_03206 [Xenorhabdus ishibashii]